MQRESVCRSAPEEYQSPLGKLQPVQGQQYFQPTQGQQSANSKAAVNRILQCLSCIVWHLSGVQDTNLNQKTQTWIRQGSQASSAVLRPVQILRHPILVLRRSLHSSAGKASRNEGWQQGLICQSRAGKIGLSAQASNKALSSCLRLPCHVGWTFIAL